MKEIFSPKSSILVLSKEKTHTCRALILLHNNKTINKAIYKMPSNHRSGHGSYLTEDFKKHSHYG